MLPNFIPEDHTLQGASLIRLQQKKSRQLYRYQKATRFGC